MSTSSMGQGPYPGTPLDQGDENARDGGRTPIASQLQRVVSDQSSSESTSYFVPFRGELEREGVALTWYSHTPG